MTEQEKESMWKVFQEMHRKEREEAEKIYEKINSLMNEYNGVIPKTTVLKRLGFKSIDEMIDWELTWLPRRELNIKMEYKEEKIKIKKNAFDEDDLSVYDFF
ncbi:MAG: hypothetical protein H7645_07645 [Candidatus Heimdallarchaeota archaeon]|nr:hypothetical protein [Candidatus Heimdallarchaeota archaeon]MCK4770197.1 hypothetical protein [Candidatus Heimdallarchaeota archaeon]